MNPLRSSLSSLCPLLVLGCGAGPSAEALSEALQPGPEICTLGFRFDVRSGPEAGTFKEGILSVEVGPGGEVHHGALYSRDGDVIPVTGETDDLDITLRFHQPGDTIVGRGRLTHDLHKCLGVVSGQLEDHHGNRGDWIGSTGTTAESAAGILYYTSGNAVYQYNFSSPATVLAGSPTLTGNVDGTGTTARFYGPYGIATDDARGVVYVADYNNQEVRKIKLSTRAVTTLLRASDARTAAAAAGFTITSFGARGLDTDSSGNLVISDPINSCVWFYNPATARFKLLAGKPGFQGNVDGTGTAARFILPSSVAFDVNSTIANVAETSTCCVRLVAENGQVSSLCALGCGL